MGDCHENPFLAVYIHPSIALHQWLTIAMPDPHPTVVWPMRDSRSAIVNVECSANECDLCVGTAPRDLKGRSMLTKADRFSTTSPLSQEAKEFLLQFCDSSEERVWPIGQ